MDVRYVGDEGIASRVFKSQALRSTTLFLGFQIQAQYGIHATDNINENMDYITFVLPFINSW